jgi:peroxiredoxin
MFEYKNFTKQFRRLMMTVTIVMLAGSSMLPAAGKTWPDFSATNLEDEAVHSSDLIGRPAIIIVTPSEDAAESTERWIEALRRELDESEFVVRTLITLDLPFFVSVDMAISDARDVVPADYHDQTWVIDSDVLEDTLGIEQGSSKAAVIILDSEGGIIEISHGSLTEQRLQTILAAAGELKRSESR